MEETRKSSIVRDLIIKIFLILLFVFLITILFPMPNLTAFYDSVFNNNVQSMKDAADSYFTKERMPEKAIITKEKKEKIEKLKPKDYENYTEKTYSKC